MTRPELRASKSVVFAHGKVMPANQAGISVMDRGFLYGDGLFETMRALNSIPIFCDDHLARLMESAEALKFTNMPDLMSIKMDLRSVLRESDSPDAYIRLNLTRGMGALGPRLQGNYRPTLIILVRPFTSYPDTLYHSGIQVAFVSWRRSKSCPIWRYKTNNYLPNILAHESIEKGAHEALFLNDDGEVTECTTSNIFCVRGDRLITPHLKANLLPGITRKKVLELAPSCGLTVEEGILNPLDLFSADEVFVTNSLMGIMPVREIQGRQPKNVKEGKGWMRTLLLTARYKQIENHDLEQNQSRWV